MVARYAAPIAYNFLNLIRLGDGAETTFEKVGYQSWEQLNVIPNWILDYLLSKVLFQRMGKMDDAAPFFNDHFNKIYPLFMVVYTILIASGFFDRIINFFGSWRKLLFKTETEDDDGFDTSGLIILYKGQ